MHAHTHTHMRAHTHTHIILVLSPFTGLVDGLDVFALINPASRIETPNVKKRHRRAKSGAKNLDTSQDGAGNDG